jgi:3-dehydroquinate dehydratase-1
LNVYKNLDTSLILASQKRGAEGKISRFDQPWSRFGSHAIDARAPVAHHFGVEIVDFSNRRPLTVGSFGSAADARQAAPALVAESCDIAEVRLDLMRDELGGGAKPWAHLARIPLLFTARMAAEGGAGNLDAATREALLREVLDDAACIDIEVASIGSMAGLIDELRQRKLPWAASFHDFEKLPENAVLEERLARAKSAGAAVFKVAAKLHSPGDVARLAEFQLADHGIAVATMGMSVLAPVSRLLCAQCGSVLNYGFIGQTSTAPGQWDSLRLKQAIESLEAFGR